MGGMIFLQKPDSIILAADHQEIVEKVDDGADYQEDDPEPEEDKYFLNDDVGCKQTNIVLYIQSTPTAVMLPNAVRQSDRKYLVWF